MITRCENRRTSRHETKTKKLQEHETVTISLTWSRAVKTAGTLSLAPETIILPFHLFASHPNKRTKKAHHTNREVEPFTPLPSHHKNFFFFHTKFSRLSANHQRRQRSVPTFLGGLPLMLGSLAHNTVLIIECTSCKLYTRVSNTRTKHLKFHTICHNSHS